MKGYTFSLNPFYNILVIILKPFFSQDLSNMLRLRVNVCLVYKDNITLILVNSIVFILFSICNPLLLVFY